MRTKTRIQKGEKLPGTYAELVRIVPPRPIRDSIDVENVTEIVDRLAGFELNRDQEDYLEALSTFVEAYESKRWPFDDETMNPIELLKALLDENGMSGSDLGRLLGQRTLGPAILRGDRGLSKAHIRILSERFKIDPALFLS